MIILRDHSPLPASLRHSVMAIGNFDGLHLGHMAVIGEALTLAQEARRPAAVMTFEPHPAHVFRPQSAAPPLLSFADKGRRLKDAGIDLLRVVHFTRAFSRTTAEHFVTDILHKQLRLSHVVTGEDFTFGFNREGNAQVLKHKAEKLGFAATAMAPVMVDGARCSSTRLRTALAGGNVAEAAELLGRHHTITGHVTHGDKRGRTLGFPTANIALPKIFMPAHGIYAVRAKLGGEWIDAAASFGTRPAFGGGAPLLEVHLLDWSGDIYGERVEIAFIERLRAECNFASPEALKAQMAEDCKAARAALAGAKH